jgi:hypothetical protein
MSDAAYSIRIDRSQGSVEISGPDKAWIAEQLATVLPILTNEKPASKPPHEGRRQDVPDPNGEKTRKSGSRTRRSSSSSGKANPNLSGLLTGEMKTKLHGYLEERSKEAKDAQSQAAVIATFLLDELDWAEVTADDLFTVYSEMGLKIPVTRAALNNAHSRKGYFSAPDDGKYRVSHKGQNFARHDSKNQ